MNAPSEHAVLEARDLCRQYEVSRGWGKPKAVVNALNGVTFRLEPGKTLADWRARSD